MTPTDDEVVARLRASLKATADRTPISAARSITVATLAEPSPSRSLVTAFSAAAAVAAMVAVAAVVANEQSGGHRSVQPGAGGAGPGAASSASAVASVSATPSSKPTPVPSAVNGSAVPKQSPGGCVPENYYVTASPAEVAGLTYMLPATPAGYALYGAWGTISRNHCADTTTWYVEYDHVLAAPDAGTEAIQLTVTKFGDHATGDASATPVAATPVTVGSVEGSVIEKDGAYAVIAWTIAGAQIALGAPISNGDIGPLVQVANSVVLVSAGDPRIVAPADCQVPPGSTCPSGSARPTPTVSPSPNLTADPFYGPPPTPTPTAP
jgi:hypothetical protein